MSRRTRNLIVLLILLPVLAYGAARLAIWYTVKEVLANVRASLSPVATLEYSEILSPILGPFGVTGIRVQPHIFEDQISVGSALIHIDDPVEKFEFLRAAMRDVIPTQFKLSLNGINIPLNGDIAASLERADALSESTGGIPGPCRTGAPFTLTDIKKLGYEELVANMIVDYSYDRRGRGLGAYLKVEFQEMFALSLEGTVPPSDVVFAVDQIQGIPRLSNLTITMRDLAWSSRFNSYCADAMGTTEAQYIERKVSEIRELLTALNFEPSPELMEGLKKFLAGEVPFSLSLNPRDPINITQLNFDEDLEFLLDRLGIEVAVDGTPVLNLGEIKKTVEEEVTEESQPQVVDETYKPTPIEELPQFLQSQVQIFTSDGKRHDGYLNGVDAQNIMLTQHLVGGSATFNVKRVDVERILVLRP